MNSLRYPLLFLATLLAFSACKKYEVDEVEIGAYDAEYAIPLINTSATLQDVLENFDSTTFIQFSDDNLIILNYKGDVNSKTSDDLFQVLSEYELIPIPLEDTATFIPYEPVDGVDLDYAILKSGTLKWGFQSHHTEPVEVTLTLPSMTKNGIPFSAIMSGPGYSGTGDPFPIFDLNGIDLTGYRLEAVNDTIYINYVAHRLNSGIMDTLSSCGITFENLVASYIEGYLGNDLYDLDRDTIEIDFFENWTRGDVYFEDPKLTVTVENSFGLPVRSKANIVNVHTADDQVLALESIYLDSININYPSLSEVGEVKYTYFDFNKENSNVDELLGANPVAVDYDMDAVPNPDSITSIRGFMTDSSYFNAQVEVELPVYGTASGFEARDTFEIDMDMEDATHAEFKIVAENEIPLDVGVQLYFANDDNVIIDSLLAADEILMAAAPVDADGKSTMAAEKITFSLFDEARFDGVRSATKLFMNARFSTLNNGAQSVKVFADNEVRIRVGMKLGIRN